MKKTITKFTVLTIAYLFMSIGAIGQNVPITHIIIGKSLPASCQQKTAYWHTETGLVYICNNSRFVVTNDQSIISYVKGQGQKGDQGIQGAPGRDGVDGAKGDKGDKGDTGAAGRDGVCPNCPPSTGGSFPYNIVIGTGNDAATMNAAIAANMSNNKPIYLVGNINTGIISVPKTAYRLTIIGYGSKWYGGLKRTTPTNNSDANEYVVARFVIEGIEFVGSQNMVALDLGASYMSAYRDLKFDGFLEAIHLRFALRTLIENCEAVNCVNGFIADMGNWTGADNANSQSNHTTMTDCRAYMPSNGQVAYGIYAASGCVVRDCIIEGFVVSKGIDFNGRNSNVVKDFTIENVHFECVNGSTVAFINIESFAGGTVTINKAFGQHASMFLKANSTSGLGFVDISNVPWWVAKGGKYFNTSNITLNFKYNEAFRGINASMWEGTAPQLCGGSGCGYNRYTYTDIPR